MEGSENLEQLLSAWSPAAAIESRLSGGNRNDVWAIRLGGRRLVARRSRRSPGALAWELDLLDHLDKAGLRVPQVVPTAAGERSIDGVAVFTWLDGDRPQSEGGWQQVAAYLRGRHECTRGWPQRPDFRSSQDLLVETGGGDVDFALMPLEAVELCRSAWRAFAGLQRSVVYGDPGGGNIRIARGEVGLLDWDEARADVWLFDLADLPTAVPELTDPELARAARRAADAWEAAACWRAEPEYARQRLARLADGR